MINRYGRILLALQLSIVCTTISLAATPEAPSPASDGAMLFESKIRPLLLENCTSCHGETQQKAGLRLDSRDAILKGGRSGPAIVPGSPEKSLLLQVIGYNGSVKMPPSGKLPADKIAAMIQWVGMGAPWPETKAAAAMAAPDYVITSDQRQFWSFVPVRKPLLPRVKDTTWAKGPIDQFILAMLESKGLKPAPPASKRTLLRRAYFDLIGLPPTPEEMDAFLADSSPDAYEKVVDRLLASPQYGERWGRRWLDSVRYADSNGLDENVAFGNAFRYRDYVVHAFNTDTPYDRFMEEQLAGDLLPSTTTEERNNLLTATGFLGLGAKVLAEPDKPKLAMDIVDEQIEVTSKTFLGLTVACARCHNHKFDPIPTKDYYGLAGIFNSTRTMESLNTVAAVYERPLVSAAAQVEIDKGNAKVKALNDDLNVLTGDANKRLTDGLRHDASRAWLAAWELARQPELKAIADAPAKPGDPQRLIIEAEKFDRGSVAADFETYGKGIGIIHTIASPSFAEWDIMLPVAGPYQLDLRYAAQDSRPVKLLVNGKAVLENAAASVTGSWQPEGQRWEPQGVFPFTAGKNTIRIERNDAIPHFDKLLLAPLKLPSEKPGAPPIRSAAEIAAAHHLNLEALRRCAVVLRPLADSPATQSWPLPETLSEEQFTAAAEKLSAALGTDPALAPLRKAAEDSKGPFGLPDHPEQYYPAADADAISKSAATLKTAQMAVPKPPMAMAVDEGTIADVRVHIRGSTENLGDEVPRHFLTILPGGESPAIAKGHSGRLELAQWLANTDNPLPARVEVNRIWQGHFGEGLVHTPDNFGLMGERPTHPKLLDWLAADFMEHGWSVKRMHRMILLSNTYRMSSALDDKANEIDPDNRLLWRMNRQRLEAEPFRDAVLKVAGKMDLTMGGSLLATADHDYVTNDQSNNAARYDTPRRSVYLPVIRNSVFDMFQAFDFGDPSLVNAHRASTTVAPQALYIMNSPFMLAQSRNFAADLLAGEAAGDPARIETAYLRALGRPASPVETARSLGFIERYSSRLSPAEPDLSKRRLRAWGAFCQALLASNEFIYID